MAQNGSKPNDEDISQWIGFTNPQEVNPQTSYVFQSEFMLPEHERQTLYRLDLDIAADNELASIHINGNEVAVPERGLEDFALRRVVIDRHLSPGKNVIKFEIVNHRVLDRTGPVGLRVEWRALALPTKPINPENP